MNTMPDAAIDPTSPQVAETHRKESGEKLTREATVTIAVLVISTFTAPAQPGPMCS